MKQDEPADRSTGRERFPRSRRLRSSRDFERVRRRGRQVAGVYLTLQYVRQPQEAGPTHVGFTVSKRVGSAVIRNRVKRRLREVTRRLRVRLPAGWDLVLVARPAAASAEYGVLAGEFCLLLQRAGFL